MQFKSGSIFIALLASGSHPPPDTSEGSTDTSNNVGGGEHISNRNRNCNSNTAAAALTPCHTLWWSWAAFLLESVLGHFAVMATHALAT